ncbi:MAG: UUP1 family membrane protein [Thermodesulfobacteriota bacterium]
MKQKHLYILALCLTISGLGCFFYKAHKLKLPLKPNLQTMLWTLEADVHFESRKGPIKVELFIPKNNPNIAITNESFISREFGLNTEIEGGNRKAVWSKRKGGGKFHLYYRGVIRLVGNEQTMEIPFDRHEKAELIKPSFIGTQLEASEEMVAEMFDKSADLEGFVLNLLRRLNRPSSMTSVQFLTDRMKTSEDKADLAVQLLGLADIPARAVHGVRLTQEMKWVKPKLVHWIEVFENGRWYAFNPETQEKGIPADYLVWWRGAMPLVKFKGGENLKVDVSLVRNQEETLFVISDQDPAGMPFLQRFSLFSLPLPTQSVYRILLLVPIGAFLIVLLRNVIGLRTLGTFMPVLIALAMRETQLTAGIILFIVLVGLGLSVRRYLEQLKLLVVPRLAAVLTAVVLMMASFSVVSHLLGLEQGLSIALFPMVIITMAIERMSILWEETGPTDALKQGAGTLAAASMIYLVMSSPILAHLVFVFPELNLVLLAAILLLGRYSGYRITELMRFKVFKRKESDA